jgi:hypothetical protein
VADGRGVVNLLPRGKPSPLGVVPAAEFRRSRRYAIVAIAVLSGLLPMLDPLTLLLACCPCSRSASLGVQLAQIFAPGPVEPAASSHAAG